jgi:uncharacterized membrane protein YfhO
VVFSANNAAGWRARVDGRPAPILAVDGALMGVLVPPGRHSVRLGYLPRSFVTGSAVSGLAAAAAVVMVLRGGRRRRPAGEARSGAVDDGPDPVPGEAGVVAPQPP